MRALAFLAGLGAFTLLPSHSTAGRPAAGARVPEGFAAVFNGRDLTGWEGSPKYWTVEDGCLTGKADGTLKYNRFIVWRGGTVKNFELRVKVKVIARRQQRPAVPRDRAARPGRVGRHRLPVRRGGQPARLQRHALRGAGPPHPGPHRRAGDHRPEGPALGGRASSRSRSSSPASGTTTAVLAEGNHQRHWIDGHPTVDVIDLDEKGRKLDGVLGGAGPRRAADEDPVPGHLPEALARRPAADHAGAGGHPGRRAEGRAAGAGPAQDPGPRVLLRRPAAADTWARSAKST